MTNTYVADVESRKGAASGLIQSSRAEKQHHSLSVAVEFITRDTWRGLDSYCGLLSV